MRILPWIIVMVLVAALAGTVAARAADPSALWHIVHDRCVPHEQKDDDPSPCTEVDISDGVKKGTAVLKDRVGATQFLLIPTAATSGIEDPTLLDPEAPNYWDAAWRARYFVEERAQQPLAWDDFALAINSMSGRTQDQLHIHIDCLRRGVKKILLAHQADIKGIWEPFPVKLAGHNYRAIRVERESLASFNPFRILANASPEIANNMGRHTLVVVGATFGQDQHGFILLDDQVDLAKGDLASGEELQDHNCSLADNG